jgi:glutamine synthetase
MHVHASLLGPDGENVFAAPDGGEATLRHAVAGLLETMPAAALLFVSSYNGFRRLMPGSYAPMSLTWGYDNRSVAVRIPNGKPAATRIEHRIAGADANPYLVLAAILGAMEEGLAAGRAAPDPVIGNAYEREAPALTGSMREAVEAFRASPFAARLFGDTYRRIFAVMKDMECREFERRVGDLEYDTYL